MLASTHLERRRNVKSVKNKSRVVTRAEVAAMIRANNNLIVETKVTYTTQNGGIDYNGSVFSFTNAMGRGDGAIDLFTGNLVRPTRLIVRGSWSTNQTYSVCRFIVFQWLDATTPVPAGVVTTLGSDLAPETSLLWSNVHKIHVLFDEKTVMFPVAGSYAAAQFTCDLSNCFRTIQFASGGTTPQMNGLFAIALSDDGAPTYPQLRFVSELRFTDA